MQPKHFYHIYNHAIGDELLFRSESNYHYFLNLWAKYIDPIAASYAYCCMPNHFHFLIQIRAMDALAAHLNLTGLEDLSGFLSKRFSNLFNAYAKAYNKMYQRKGSLFVRPFKCKVIYHPAYLLNLVNYIYRNPVHHGFRERPEEWPYSSYDSFRSTGKTRLCRDEVISWFGNVTRYERYHQRDHLPGDPTLLIE